MSQPNPKFSDFDYTPAIPRRGPAPLTNLPVNALSGDMDPTRDLRNLIEQLQHSAREARNQAQIAEAERDQVAVQLEQLRRQNEDLRTHFVEITSIIRERDNALAEVERLGRAASEAQARIATAQRELSEGLRQRDELSRARDDAHRQLEALTRASQDANRRFNDVQRQLFSIRQARDAAQAQNTELQQKLNSFEEQRSELQDQLDAAEKALAETRGSAVDPEQLAVLTQERDAAQQQVAELTGELQELRAKVIELTEQKTAAIESSHANTTALMEAREQVAQLTHERDQAREEITAKEHLIDEIRKNPDEATAAELEQARQEITNLKVERESAEMRSQSMTRELAEMRQQLQSRAEQIAAVQRSFDDASVRLASMQVQFEQLTQERTAAVTAREEAMTSLSAAQKQIERVIRERDLARQQSSDNAIAMEAQIEALLAELAAYEGADPTIATRTGEIRSLAGRLSESEQERRDLAERLDKQRSETIDLGAQLQAAQEQIRELSASLAEARLQALSGGRSSQKRATSTSSSIASGASRSATTGEVFDAGSVVSAMRHDYQAFLKNPSELRLLNDIAGHAQVYAELARTCGLAATYQVGTALAGLTQELFRYPEQVNPTILRTVHQGVEFLATLPKLGNLAQAKDPATATVYAVDDDPDNCECIRMAMETAMVRTTSVQDPSQAVIQLASMPCDLIFLDVSMPGMDGFELCTEIRNMALHMNTPVIFLTGLTSAENRVQSNMSGGNEFVGKPFLLGELTLKALMLMMKAQLHLA